MAGKFKLNNEQLFFNLKLFYIDASLRGVCLEFFAPNTIWHLRFKSQIEFISTLHPTVCEGLLMGTSNAAWLFLGLALFSTGMIVLTALTIDNERQSSSEASNLSSMVARSAGGVEWRLRTRVE